MRNITLKFGGSSLCTEGYEIIHKQILDRKKEGFDKIIVVVSANEKITNKLYAIVKDRENWRKTYDEIKEYYGNLTSSLNFQDSQKKVIEEVVNDMNLEINDITNLQDEIKYISNGEIISSLIMHMYLLNKEEMNSIIDSYQYIISPNIGSNIDPTTYNLKGCFQCNTSIISKIEAGFGIFIAQGFIARTADDMCCVLTRSGSDTTASLIASAIKSERLEIWTDVSGIYTADPRVVKDAAIIPRINYDICQELSSSGARVLHPDCIRPCRKAKIPIYIRNTFDPDGKITIVDDCAKKGSNDAYAISINENVTTYHIISGVMFENIGIAQDVFAVFKESDIEIDIITTSQVCISCTTTEKSKCKRKTALEELQKRYCVKVNDNCSIVTLVANDVLDNVQLGTSMKIIKELGRENLYMTHYSSNNMALSFVVNKKIAHRLSILLHNKFIFRKSDIIDNMDIWWRREAFDIGHGDGYYYHIPTIIDKCRMLKTELFGVINKIYYAMKANDNIDVIKTIANQGIDMECVSQNEIEFIRKECGLDCHIHFSPNFCPISEIVYAFDDKNTIVVIDNVELIKRFPEVFAGEKIGLRLDLDSGMGHNTKVMTEGDEVKFGLPLYDLPELMELCEKNKITITHIHSHKGSGILDHNAWADTLRRMKEVIIRYNLKVKSINLGGGLGIFSNGKTLDLTKMRCALMKEIDETLDGIQLYIEPGRFIVSEAGILVTKVNQIKEKGSHKYLGISSGMNALIRPALYNAYHPIYNLSKIENDIDTTYTIVGPICESGDILGNNIKMPKAEIGDVVIIENVGAYGRVMASRYNMRHPPKEICLF